MTHRSMRASATLVTSALLALAVAAPAAADSASRPFTGWGSGEVSFVPVPLELCPANGVFFGGLETVQAMTGQTTHLGGVTMRGVHCTPAGDAIGPGTMAFVAANGDEVYATYAGSAPFPGPGTTIIVVHIEFQVVGGTGRFEGATGGGTMTVHVVFEGFEDPAWAAAWSWDGTIGY